MAPTTNTLIDSSSHQAEVEPTKSTVDTVAVKVRSYTPRDLPAVVEVFSSGLLEYADQDGQEKQLWVDHIQQCIKADLASIDSVYFASGGHFWVATVEDPNGDEVVVGIVGLEGKPNNEGELRRMSVKTEYRRYGVGRLLVAKLEQWAQTHGLTKVFLSTGSPMVQAQKFYKSIGYEHTKTRVYPTVEMLVFEKKL